MSVVRREPLLMPDLGLGTTPMVASVWLVAKGQEVTAGDPVLEVVATGVVVDLVAPFSGRLVEKRVMEDDLLQIGMVLGFFERVYTSGGAESASPPAAEA
jgi:2-oxoglutarate dehydrogenase E2 component (dihydrolipoamide succinyltransferase)